MSNSCAIVCQELRHTSDDNTIDWLVCVLMHFGDQLVQVSRAGSMLTINPSLALKQPKLMKNHWFFFVLLWLFAQPCAPYDDFAADSCHNDDLAQACALPRWFQRSLHIRYNNPVPVCVVNVCFVGSAFLVQIGQRPS